MIILFPYINNQTLRDVLEQERLRQHVQPDPHRLSVGGQVEYPAQIHQGLILGELTIHHWSVVCHQSHHHHQWLAHQIPDLGYCRAGEVSVWHTLLSALMKTYYKGSSAALIIYDITREETFLNLDNEQKLISTSPPI